VLLVLHPVQSNAGGATDAQIYPFRLNSLLLKELTKRKSAIQK
jgi:hypothetical protein